MSRLFAALAVSLLLSPASWGLFSSALSSLLELQEPESFAPPASLASDGGGSADPWGGPNG